MQERLAAAHSATSVARLGRTSGPIWQHWCWSQRGQCALDQGALAGGQRWVWGAATNDHTAGGHLGSPRGEDAFSVSQVKATSSFQVVSTFVDIIYIKKKKVFVKKGKKLKSETSRVPQLMFYVGLHYVMLTFPKMHNSSCYRLTMQTSTRTAQQHTGQWSISRMNVMVKTC